MSEELIVIFSDDGTTHIDVISEENFIGYRILPNNMMEAFSKRCQPPHHQWEEYSTTCEIDPHNKHALVAFQKWSSNKHA